jgi:hypothetical protein
LNLGAQVALACADDQNQQQVVGVVLEGLGQSDASLVNLFREHSGEAGSKNS